jgi:hypothetical protein
MFARTSNLLTDMQQLLSNIQSQRALQEELTRELHSTRRMIAQCYEQQALIVRASQQEMTQQYRQVAEYASYLEDCIAHKIADPQLRYDFDEVCESGFNLRLMSSALETLGQEIPFQRVRVPVAHVMQETVIALAASLDRRCMQLSTLEVDLNVEAQADPERLLQVIWLMLMGIIRYAADESLLSMHCSRNEADQRSIISITVDELAPGHLSPDERHSYLMRQMRHGSQHMFAETLKVHAHVQLAELLLKRMEGSITVIPLSSHACELRLSLPAAD